MLLCVALRQEAQPFIKHFHLKKDLQATEFEVFSRGDTHLIISGIGKVRAALAVQYIISRYGNPNHLLANVGTCGVRPDSSLGIGTLVLAHSIRDHGSSEVFFPDLPISHSLHEVSLECFDTPVQGTSDLDERTIAVDMESAGILIAGQRFLSPSHLCCIKMVTDHLNPDILHWRSNVEQLNAAVSQVVAHLLRHEDVIRDIGPVLDTDIQATLHEVEMRLRLGTEEKQILHSECARVTLDQSQSLDYLSSVVDESLKKGESYELVFTKILNILRTTSTSLLNRGPS